MFFDNHHQYEKQFEKDVRRDQRLSELGMKALRFENQFVFNHLALVLQMIEAEFGD